MRKIREHIFGILIAIFICMGGCSVVFGKREIVQGGLTSLFWAVALFIFGYITLGKNERDLQSFDLQSKEILIDLGVNGMDSDYYGIYDASALDKLRRRQEKKGRKQVVGVFSVGIILVITAFIFIF